MERGYFQDDKGNRSSSRLTAFIIAIAALLFVQEILIIAALDPLVGLVEAATASATLFVTIAGPALAFQFAQKRTEQKTADHGKTTTTKDH